MARFNKYASRKARHARIRKNLSGTPERPRLCIYKSNANIYAQIIDDVNGKTLVQASTLDKSFDEGSVGSNVESAKKVGELVAKRALDNSIEEVVFDRSGYIYHGKVKARAEAAREAGLRF